MRPMQKCKHIPGVTARARTDLPVLHPFDVAAHSPDSMMMTRWVAGLPWWTPVATLGVAALWPAIAYAQSNYSTGAAFEALWRWMPFLLSEGFLLNVLISVFAMLIGTALGAMLGLGQISLNKWVRRFAWSCSSSCSPCPSRCASSARSSASRTGGKR